MKFINPKKLWLVLYSLLLGLFIYVVPSHGRRTTLITISANTGTLGTTKTNSVESGKTSTTQLEPNFRQK